nr:DUF3052 family protein [Streptomyces violens]
MAAGSRWADGESQQRLNRDGAVGGRGPNTGKDGHTEPSHVNEAATSAGLSQTQPVSAAVNWTGIKLVTPKTGKR